MPEKKYSNMNDIQFIGERSNCESNILCVKTFILIITAIMVLILKTFAHYIIMKNR